MATIIHVRRVCAAAILGLSTAATGQAAIRDYVPNVSRKAEVNHAMVQALGFGGHNTVLVMKRYVA